MTPDAARGDLSLALAVIPARGGSKGVPRKNLRLVGGKPLIAHSIEQARAARAGLRVVVSTDDAEIAALARSLGAEVVQRPHEISGDTASSESALRHVLETLAADEGYVPDVVVFLQCTSPLRRADDIDRALALRDQLGATSLLSVVRSHRFLWRHAGGVAESLNYDWRHRPRRQDREPEFLENGSIYVFPPSLLLETGNRLGGVIAMYEMDERSAIDIDSEEDLALCDWLLSRERGASLPDSHHPVHAHDA